MPSLPKIPRRLSFALLAFCFTPLVSQAVDDPAKIRAIVDAAIRPVMAEYRLPGMAVAVTVDGEEFFINYGVASIENNIPVSEATLFEIGSLTKPMTASLTSYAQVLGKLSLADHPGKYMARLKGSPIDMASLLNLGTYTAGGLPLQFPDTVTHDGMTDYFRHWQPDAPAGTQREYSNPSIGLLGHITGLSFKRDFSEVMETTLFRKLGLNHSYIRVPESAMADYAWGYDAADKAIRVNPGVLAAGAYGVKSTTADMIRFVQANIDPSRLEKQMQRAIEGTHIGYFQVGDLVQGLGWEQFPYPITLQRLLAGNANAMLLESNAATPIASPQIRSARTLFDKTGSTNGFGAYVAFVPEKKLGVVLLANKNYPIPARISAAYAILEQLAEIAR